MIRQPTARDRRFGLPVLMLLLLPFLAAAQEAPTRVGYVDMQRLIDSAPQVVQARTRLRNEFADQDRALDADAQRLTAMDERIRREADLMSKADADALKRDAETLRASIARTRDRLSRELSSRIDEELDSAWPDIEARVAEYAREAGYDLVIGSPVIYASGRVDITDRVLDRLRQANGEKP